jgi:hypothetical protein
MPFISSNKSLKKCGLFKMHALFFEKRLLWDPSGTCLVHVEYHSLKTNWKMQKCIIVYIVQLIWPQSSLFWKCPNHWSYLTLNEWPQKHTNNFHMHANDPFSYLNFKRIYSHVEALRVKCHKTMRVV